MARVASHLSLAVRERESPHSPVQSLVIASKVSLRETTVRQSKHSPCPYGRSPRCVADGRRLGAAKKAARTKCVTVRRAHQGNPYRCGERTQWRKGAWGRCDEDIEPYGTGAVKTRKTPPQRVAKDRAPNAKLPPHCAKTKNPAAVAKTSW